MNSSVFGKKVICCEFQAQKVSPIEKQILNAYKKKLSYHLPDELKSRIF